MKALRIGATGMLLLSLAACGGPEPYSTDESCSELDAAFTNLTSEPGTTDQTLIERVGPVKDVYDRLPGALQQPLAKMGFDGVVQRSEEEIAEGMIVVYDICGWQLDW